MSLFLTTNFNRLVFIFFKDYPNFQDVSGAFSGVSTTSEVVKGFQGFQESLATLFDVSSLISLARYLTSINKNSSYLADFDCYCVKGVDGFQ